MINKCHLAYTIFYLHHMKRIQLSPTIPTICHKWPESAALAPESPLSRRHWKQYNSWHKHQLSRSIVHLWWRKGQVLTFNDLQQSVQHHAHTPISLHKIYYLGPTIQTMWWFIPVHFYGRLHIIRVSVLNLDVQSSLNDFICFTCIS